MEHAENSQNTRKKNTRNTRRIHIKIHAIYFHRALIVTFQGEHHFDPDDGYHLTTIDSVEGRQAVIHVDDIIGLCGILKDLHGDPNSQIPLYSELSTARQPRMFIITKNFKGDFIHLVSDDIQ